MLGLASEKRTAAEKEDIMALEWLKTILGDGYTEDIESKIAQEIGKGFVSKADFNAVKTQQKKLEDDLKTRDTQLEELKKVQGIEFIEMDSDKVLVPGELEKEAAAIVAHCSQQIAKGITCCVSTKRVVLTLPDDTPEAALVRSVAISDALQSCVGRLTASPAFVVAKGGITSSDVGVKALRVKCAKVLGQIRPGIPVWQTGAESLFPGTPYIIFPGNVGEVSTLREAVEILLG